MCLRIFLSKEFASVYVCHFLRGNKSLTAAVAVAEKRSLRWRAPGQPTAWLATNRLTSKRFAVAKRSKKSIPISFRQIVWKMIVVTVFLMIMGRTDFRWVHYQKENCHDDYVPFNLEGIVKIFIWECARRRPIFIPQFFFSVEIILILSVEIFDNISTVDVQFIMTIQENNQLVRYL